MKLSTHVKPITYLKANASEVIRNFEHDKTPLVITQNGEAKCVVQDIKSFEAMQETLALLKILALGKAQVEKGEFVGIEDVRSHFANKS